MKIINKATGGIIAEIVANHSMTLDEALTFVSGLETLGKENPWDPDFEINGQEIWYDDLEMQW